MWENSVERGRPQKTKWHMRIACWIPKATNTRTHTHTHTVFFNIYTFTLPNVLHESTSILNYSTVSVLFKQLQTRLQNAIYFAYISLPLLLYCECYFILLSWRICYLTHKSVKVTKFSTKFNIQQFYVLPTDCIYVFCADLRINSNYFPIQH